MLVNALCARETADLYEVDSVPLVSMLTRLLQQGSLDNRGT